MEERTEAMYECLGYFTELWHARSDGQRGDFITALSNHPDTNDMVDRPLEYLGNLLRSVGGNDTTETVFAVLPQRNRDQFDKLKADHGLIKSLCLKSSAGKPTMHMRRIATRDVELGGKLIKKGDKVVMYVSATETNRSLKGLTNSSSTAPIPAYICHSVWHTPLHG